MATINKITRDNFTPNPATDTPFPVYAPHYNAAVDQINANTTLLASTASLLTDTVAYGTGLNTTIGGTTSVGKDIKILVSLTSANLLAMNATPITVIASQGAGTAIKLKSCIAIFDSTVTTYANGGVIYLSYNNTTPITNNLAATFLTAGDKVFSLNPLAAAGGNNMLVATPLTITNDTAAFITGTGVVRLLIEYEVINTGL